MAEMGGLLDSAIPRHLIMPHARSQVMIPKIHLRPCLDTQMLPQLPHMLLQLPILPTNTHHPSTALTPSLLAPGLRIFP